jgi:hypothetical protein
MTRLGSRSALLLLLLLLLLPLVFVCACETPDDDDSAPDDDDDIFAQDDDDTTPGGDDDDSNPGDDDDDDDTGGGGDADITGDWVDTAGSTYSLTDSLWTITPKAGDAATFDITEFHTDNQFAVGQNGASNPDFPALWSRFEWIPAEGAGAFLCHRVQDGSDALTAGGVSPADPSNPTVSGCREEPWITLTPG